LAIKNIMAECIMVPENYRCPLCPDHKDDTFLYSKILGAPICEGCAFEISFFVESDKRPNDFVLDQLEALTGLSFLQYKRIAFEQTVEDFANRLKPENVEREAQFEMQATECSLEEVIKRWKDLIGHYKTEINRLKAESGNQHNVPG
jgi:hypothetical protein